MQKLILVGLMATISLSAADVEQHKKKKMITPKVTPGPTPTPSPHYSPNLLKKTEPAENFRCLATEVGIHNSHAGGPQNLESYLHGTFHQMHDQTHEQIQDLQSRHITLSAAYNELIEHHKKTLKLLHAQVNTVQTQLAGIQSSYTALLEAAQKTIQVQVGEDRTISLSQALQELQDKIDDIKNSHHIRIADIEATQKPETQHGWIRKLFDHCIAFSAVVTGVCYAGRFSQLAAKTMATVSHSGISIILPYTYIPAGLLFLSYLASDIRQNAHKNAQTASRDRWQRYRAYLSTISYTAAHTIYRTLKPACTMVVGAVAVNVLFAAYANRAAT